MERISSARDGPALPPALPRDPERAWDEFLRAFAPLILQIVHLFERDPDRIDDCFLFVCERLRRDDLRRIRRFRADGTASFATWLRVVARNLCLDWRRARFGRIRLPRSIARLPRLDQEVFRCLHLRALSEHEALHVLRPLFPGITRAQLDESAARVRRSLDDRQRWFLLTRRPRVESIESGADGEEAHGAAREPADPQPDPELVAERLESLAALTAALGHLPARDRLLVRLRFEQELPLVDVARLAGLGSAEEAERILRRAMETMRGELAARMRGAVSVKGAQAGAPKRPTPEMP